MCMYLFYVRLYLGPKSWVFLVRQLFSDGFLSVIQQMIVIIYFFTRVFSFIKIKTNNK